jgi:hypothetical protein
MSRWTETAKARLERYFSRMRTSLAASGADADEVAEDLRRHIEEEVVARHLSVVTDEDLGQILARIGPSEAEPIGGWSATAGSEPDTSLDQPAHNPPGWWLFTLGVLVPFAAIAFEFVSGACAGSFLDPLPTLAHVALAGFVPLANLVVWLEVRRGTVRWLPWLGWANGAAIAISLVFAIVFLPLTPFALASILFLLGLLFYGIGLAPLAPLLSFICALALRGHLRRARGRDGRLPGLWPGFALGFCTLATFTVPMILTEVGLELALSDDPAQSTRGVRLLRVWGEDEDLLRACYGRIGRASEVYSWGKPIDPETARYVYYRVHGRPFNAVPPPKLYAGRARWDLMEQEFTWDNDQGGNTVAGRIKGLTLIHSRQDAVLEPDAALAYIEWTLEFKNDSPLQREARAQIALPAGGVVSRLTLWIDGEEREAAFGGRSQVKTAYREVVQQRRDPVVVTTCGPDRALMQCFPVPANGGRMKVRLGVTAPLVLTTAESGSLRWPSLAERNFTVADKFRHSLWVQSSQAIETSSTRFKSEAARPGIFALRGDLSDPELALADTTLRAHRVVDTLQSWTRDTREDNSPFIRQTITERPVTAPDRVVLVVDGTEGMQNFFHSISAALVQLPTNIDFALLIARDGCEEIVPIQKGTVDLYKSVALGKFSSRGGHDNVPALLRAWDLAAAEASAIVWIHGPQPIVRESVEDLRQRFERSLNAPLLVDVETQIGPNRVLEGLDGLNAVHPLPRLGDLGDDLSRLFATWTGRAPRFELIRESVPAAPSAVNPPGKEASLHLARLWAAAEAKRLLDARQNDAAIKLAARHQLVTPVSGAVVLETQAQYQRAGLQPATPESVPIIPEPSAAWLLALGLLFLTLRLVIRARHPRSEPEGAGWRRLSGETEGRC